MPGRMLVCIPTYNEKDNVEPLSAALLSQAASDTEILFIDDGSPDGTGEILKKLTMQNSRIHVIHRKGKLGLATAYIQAFQWGLARGYQWFVEMDADFSHDPKYIQDIEKLIEQGDADVLCGSRYVKGGGISNWSRRRLMLSRSGSLYSRLLLGYPLKDWTGGFNTWSRQVVEALELQTIKSRGYGFQIEMKYRALVKGFRVREFPIVFQERRAGHSKMSGSIVREAILGVLKLRLAKQAGKLFQ